MAAIKLTAFIGEQPRITPHLLPPNAATRSVNVRHTDGALTPTRQSILEEEIADIDAGLDAAAVQTIYKWGSDWLAWESVVNAVPGPVATDRLYFTGDGVPKMLADDGGGLDEYELAVPTPVDPLVAATDEAGTGELTDQSYVFTYVTIFGEESAPSPPSNTIAVKPGDGITLSDFETVPTGRNITKQRIYRSQTGAQGDYYYFIEERNAGTGDFTDDIDPSAFQEPLPSADWTEPPDALAGLTELPNGMMAAFVGRDLYFCEPWRPHAWPEKYVLTTSYPIVALGAIGGVLIVATTGTPFVVQGSHPAQMRMDKVEKNLPCINGRALVDLGQVVAYPSHEGLVAVLPNGQADVVTRNLFGQKDWLALSPSTMVAGQKSGRYVAFYDTTDENGDEVSGALFLDIGENPFLVRSSVKAQAAYYEIETGKLFYLATGTDDIVEIDANTAALQQMFWKSKEFLLSFDTSFGAILIQSPQSVGALDIESNQDLIDAIVAANAALIAAGSIDGEMNAAEMNTLPVNGDILEPLPGLSDVMQATVYAQREDEDGNSLGLIAVATVSTVNKIVRLPSGFLSKRWAVAIAGDRPVVQIIMARNVREIQAAAAG